MSREIVERIKKREGNYIIKERRFERERNDDEYECIKKSFKDITEYTYIYWNNVYLVEKGN